ncbi:isochorismatase family protein [Candidatus Hydrogenedentota bacterium]
MKTALILVDIQNDFCPGGALPVPGGGEVVAPANQLLSRFAEQGRPIYLTRDWHPADHSSFKEQGGIWPHHCVVGSPGAEFHQDMIVPEGAVVVSTGAAVNKEGYSGFEGAQLADDLTRKGVEKLVVVGLATDYCVKSTVLDALKRGFSVSVVIEGVRAVDVNPGDGQKAIEEMRENGADIVSLDDVV